MAGEHSGGQRGLRHPPAPASHRAADELVSAFALTLVARAQTQRTYEYACRRFTRWLGTGGGS
jgi:hypothetical protein